MASGTCCAKATYRLNRAQRAHTQVSTRYPARTGAANMNARESWHRGQCAEGDRNGIAFLALSRPKKPFEGWLSDLGARVRLGRGGGRIASPGADCFELSPDADPEPGGRGQREPVVDLGQASAAALYP